MGKNKFINYLSIVKNEEEKAPAVIAGATVPVQGPSTINIESR